MGDLSRDKRLVCYAQDDAQIEGILYKFASRWVALAREEPDLGDVPGDERWQPCSTNPDSDSVWIDDFSNLLGTLDWN